MEDRHIPQKVDKFLRIRNQPKRRVQLSDLQIEILYKISTSKELNLEKVSKELDVPKSTVYYNFKKLEDEGVIRGVNLDIDQNLLGVDITAITFVRTKYVGASGDSIGVKLANIPGVIAVYYMLGDIDFIVISKAMNREDLKRIIDSIAEIEGVERTSTQYVLNVIKEEPDFFANYPIEVAKKLFGED